MKSPRFDRRTALKAAASGWGLRALATGLPLGALTAPRSGWAQAQSQPDFLVLAVSERGDPLNANAPGTYIEGVVNNPLPELAPVDMRLGDVTVQAARTWAELPEDLRSRLAFLHMRTGVVTHPDIDRVLELGGAVTGSAGNRTEMLPSMVAAEAAPLLETVLAEPIPLGRESLRAGGLPLDNISPAELKSLFSASTPQLASLAALRDQALDAIYNEVRTTGTRAQRNFLDRYAQSRAQARLLGEQLGGLLERVSDAPADQTEEARDQLLAAVALFQLKVTPVVTVNIPMGADNHQDDMLEVEAEDHVAASGLIRDFWAELKAAGLQDKTTFATLNVFGRTLLRNQAGGRDHNGNHHVMAAFGPRVRAGVYGGIERLPRDFGATAIDSATGAADPEGDVPAEETLLSAGQTLLAWAGLPDEVASRRLTGGRRIAGMVR